MTTTQMRGGLVSLTDSARKQRKKQIDRYRSRVKIFIEYYFERWNKVRAKPIFRLNHEVVGFLLDRFANSLYYLYITFLNWSPDE